MLRFAVGKDSAVGYDRDGYGGLCLFDLIVIRSAVIHHTAAPPMDRDHVSAGFLTHLREFRGNQLVLPDADARFYGYRFSAFFTAADDSGRPSGIGQKRAALSALKDIRYRTSHIDIDDIEAGQSLAAGGPFHHRRIGAKKLHGPDPFFSGGVQKLFCGFIFIFQRVGADHFRKTEAGSQLLTQHSKGPGGVAGQGRHQHIGREKQMVKP